MSKEEHICEGAGPEEDYATLSEEDFEAAEAIRNSTIKEIE